MRNTRFVLTVAICLVACAAASAGPDRRWGKFHQRVQLGDDAPIAEFTRIQTVDNRFPMFSRSLYEAESGALLVIRSAIDSPDGAGSLSVLHTATGEKLTAETRPDGGIELVTVSIGDASISFEDGEPFPAEARREGAALLGEASPTFSAALADLTVVGSRHSTEFTLVAFLLRELFFHDVADALDDVGLPATAFDTEFDPLAVPPGAFELQFGEHYFE